MKQIQETIIGYQYGAVFDSYIPVYQVADTLYSIGDTLFGLTKRPRIDITTEEYELIHTHNDPPFNTLEKIESFLSTVGQIDEEYINMPLLRYYGSKWRIAQWVLDQFPPHSMYDTYVDLFGGSGAVLLRKYQRSPVEIYNDIDIALWNFMTTLRDCRDDLIEKIMYTPYSRFELSQCHIPRDAELVKTMIDELGRVEVARRYYVLSWQGRGLNISSSRSNGSVTSWRFVVSPSHSYVPNVFYDPEDILMAADRFRGVQIECYPWENIIKLYDSPKTLFYCDPPYSHSSKDRTVKIGYQTEMTDDEHRKLAEALHNIEGFAIVSGYQSDLYSKIYADWEYKTRDALTENSKTKTEYLWISPNITSIQMRMF